ncbi:MAG: hypothetical protein UY78_C0006G0002 [Parcubacteria group bacterium GW2011_GWA1_53_13]|uniref:Uncharacterized protein n=2 Tax=Candidatus Adleribacteriota TaxID=1752736 RepID=A0A1F4XYQ5_9BACT|nr:MAG: hypothetical protein UY78_C0006G0002 [Parcubacteria group bacterium GW2011_GWA1_53_13]KKW37744.1 MAG: hypothetical protein UY86_C0004G0073 [Candidatus Adlerbacteria bacterium GW2011_GWB1_54_7]OGC78720.1 MAG: hypothetical protein A2852_00575 [Candidatus Adlerbacteria bacterium RIFCSPHIGHO2_01_FULL_54_23]OGC86855.1 MAG: hypothetical protein A3B33_02945 [Candidatus Adlerbacteria bacterium RIFCSPLOWO2_01_FULL_54_16]
MAVTELVGKFVNVILNPLLALLFAVGTLVFIFGLVEFLAGLSAESLDKKEAGKRHMLYGLVGMFIMVTAWSLVSLIGITVGNPVSNFGFPSRAF